MLKYTAGYIIIVDKPGKKRFEIPGTIVYSDGTSKTQLANWFYCFVYCYSNNMIVVNPFNIYIFIIYRYSLHIHIFIYTYMYICLYVTYYTYMYKCLYITYFTYHNSRNPKLPWSVLIWYVDAEPDPDSHGKPLESTSNCFRNPINILRYRYVYVYIYIL